MATAVSTGPGRSASGQRDAGRERGDIRLVGPRVMHQALGSPLSERDEGLGVWRVGSVIALTAATAV
jgi:hypothetical protein